MVFLLIKPSGRYGCGMVEVGWLGWGGVAGNATQVQKRTTITYKEITTKNAYTYIFMYIFTYLYKIYIQMVYVNVQLCI